MAQWINTWRIISPNSRKASYTQTSNVGDHMDLSSAGYGGGAYSSISWYSNLLKGAGARLQRYKQYDGMDTGDITRALDIIAEEISAPDKRTGLPFIIDYQTEDNQSVSETSVTTIRAALRHWAKLHNLSKRIFSVARTMVKYGDCFFRKTSDTKKWEFIDPTRVIGIEIDAEGNRVMYHIRPSSFTSSITASNSASGDSVDLVPARAMVHFSLSDDMGDRAPFGISVLQSAYKDYQKLTMLEDAAIIYRIVRAPERRVFSIDVGNMPPQRIKQYLEQIKNDLRQKRTPNSSNPGQTDSTYNPECLALDTRIPLLDGRTLELQELITEFNEGKTNWVYSCDPITGEIKPGDISWAGVTRKNTQTVAVLLDNGETITCTPDHEFPIQGIGFVRADKLTPEMSLVPFARRWKSSSRLSTTPFHSGYEEVYDVHHKEWLKTHRIVDQYITLPEYAFELSEDKTTVHHVNFNKHDNSPINLVKMGIKDHMLFHSAHNKNRFDSWSNEQQTSQVTALHVGLSKYGDELSDNRINSYTDRASRRRANNEKAGRLAVTRRKSLYGPALSQRLNVNGQIISYLTDKIKNDPTIRKTQLLEWMQKNPVFLEEYRNINSASKTGRRSAPTWTYIDVIKEHMHAANYVDLKQKVVNSNHKIVSVTMNDVLMDTGCITVGESVHAHHTFALESGVFTKNSIQEDLFFPVTASGRGSRVETLPGGANWEIPELDYFMSKVFRALRVPTSYMKGQDAAQGGGLFSDGKTGVAYMEERIFANYVMRLQAIIEEIFDEQFKTYLAVTGINIDAEIFKLTLTEPQNFALYRQAALDTDLISSFKSLEETQYLSKRFILERYLGLTKDEIQMNELMVRQERGMKDNPSVDIVQQTYDPAVYDNRAEISVDATEGEDDQSTTPA